MRTNHSGVTEVAHIRTNQTKYAEGYDAIDWSKKEENKPNCPLQVALDKYKKLHFKPILCTDCLTSEGVKHDDPSGNDYCWPCLEKYLRANTEELFESINETPDYNY